MNLKTVLVCLTALSANLVWSREIALTSNTVAVKVADGFTFAEGPVRDGDGNILFTDIPEAKIHKYDVDAGAVSVWLENDGNMNGLYFGPDGKLYACQEASRSVVAIDPDTKAVTIIAGLWDNKKFNNPNDLWINSQGGIYFTDPPFRRPPNEMEQDGEYVFYVSPDHSTVLRVVNQSMQKPNGIIGTPDNRILYVSEWDGGPTWAYDIQEDGTLANQRQFTDFGSDGMTIDERGNIYLTPMGQSFIAIHNPAGERILAIQVAQGPTNCTFGGVNNMTLFITTPNGLYSVEMNVRGQKAGVQRWSVF